LTFKHAVVAGLCVWAMYIQMTYRVPGRFFFWLLPWIGLALSCLSIVFLINQFSARIRGEGPLREALRQVEWCASLLIRIFVFYGLVLYANGGLDFADPSEKPSKILSISGGELDLGTPVPYSWVNLRSWDDPNGIQRLFLRPEERDLLWGGEIVTVHVRPGFFGIPWVAKIERDEEHYVRQILQVTPSASLAWDHLIRIQLKQKRWKEAVASTNGLLKVSPRSYDSAFDVGSQLCSNGRYDEGVPFLEIAVRGKPSYDGYQQLGWALSYQGNKKRAAEVLENSIPLNPDYWEAYYHLGYVYGGLGRLEDSLAMFEKTLERRPDFPEVETRIVNLRKVIASARKT
jgi:tetratricopeptide (TPR) repeat protein